MSSEMSGRICLLTGATNGIGRIVAQSLAQMGASLTLVGRDGEKTERVISEIRSATGNQDIHSLIGDLSSVREVKRMAEAYRENHDALHVLVNNAGAMFTSRHTTAEGFEKTFALNHLAYFQLTRELLGLLDASGPDARVVNVASGAHFRGKMDFDDLQSEQRYRSFPVYCMSKLCNVLFTQELARRLEADHKDITVNCMHPGFVRTGFGKNDGTLMKIGISIAGLFGRTPAKGAETLTFLASSPDVAGKSGEYYFDLKPRRPSHSARDPENARRLWEASEALVEKALAGNL